MAKGRSLGVQSVNRALSVIEVLTEELDELSLSEVSERVNLHPSTVHRLLSTLETRGFVRQDPRTRLYGLGARFLTLVSRGDQAEPLRLTAHPHLRELAQKTQETVNLVMPDVFAAVIVDRVESPQKLRFSIRVGESLWYHCTAGGKMLLAEMSPDRQERVLAGQLPRLTSKTLTNPEELRKELNRIHRRGYATDDEEREIGVRCVATPVRTYNGGGIVAVSLSGPSSRIKTRQFPELVGEVRKTADRISRDLGHEEEQDIP